MIFSMPLPVIAAVGAGIVRGAAVAGRAAVSSGRAAGSASARSSSQMKSRFQQGRTQARQMENVNKLNKRERTEQEDETGPQPNMFGGASRSSQFKSATAMLKQFNAMQAQTPADAKPAQDLAKAAAKKMIPKAAIFIANQIAVTLELGTAGIAFLLTVFIRLITLGWYNTEMIYGGWIMKGKHKLIGPLNWDPIPIPFAKKNSSENAISKTLLVLIADFMIVIVMMLPLVYLIVYLSILDSINPF